MESLSANFSRSEFACKCGCGFDSIDPGLVAALQQLRDQLGRAIEVLSGCRCAEHNAAEGGALHSEHVAGRAADIRVAELPARELYTEAARICEFHGYGVDDERDFVHVDVRDVPARWCYHHGRETPWQDISAIKV